MKQDVVACSKRDFRVSDDLDWKCLRVIQNKTHVKENIRKKKQKKGDNGSVFIFVKFPDYKVYL